MDILMTYWNSVWRNSVGGSGHSLRTHSAAEYEAFLRQTRRHGSTWQGSDPVLLASRELPGKANRRAR